MAKHPHQPERWSHANANTGKLLVNPVDIAALRQRLSQRGAELGRAIGSTGAHELHVQSGRSEALADELLRADLTHYAHPEVIYEATAIPTDSAWNDSLEDWQHAWDLQKGGSKRVAVLDTGCNTFTDFSANVLPGRNVLSGTTNVTDNVNHGTAGCSLIAADTNNGSTGGGVAGLGWGVNVVPVKVANSGSYPESDTINGIDWVVSNNAAEIISMAFAGPSASSQAMIDEVAAAWAAGLIICASAGNTDNTTTQYPAAIANVVAVAGCAATSRDRFLAGIAGGSSYGSWTEAAGHIGIAVNEVQRAYDRNGAQISYQGTSSSCPALCAALALMWGFKPTATNSQILAAMIATADPVRNDWGSPPHPAYALNVYRAVDYLRTDTTRRGSAIAFGGF